MNITVRAITENKEILNACRVTVWKDSLEKEPSKKFMDNIYISEHSPIRDKFFVIEIQGIKSWIATHFTRHSIGVTPYVATQREDRVEDPTPRDDKKQGERVNMRMTLNAQSFISISRKRKCYQAHKETINVWNEVLEELKNIDESLFNACVVECVYRGFCPELYPCGYSESPKAKTERQNYVKDHPMITLF